MRVLMVVAAVLALGLMFWLPGACVELEARGLLKRGQGR